MRLHNLLERMIVSSKQNSYPTLSQHVIELNFKSMQYLWEWNHPYFNWISLKQFSNCAEVKKTWVRHVEQKMSLEQPLCWEKERLWGLKATQIKYFEYICGSLFWFSSFFWKGVDWVGEESLGKDHRKSYMAACLKILEGNRGHPYETISICNWLPMYYRLVK